MSTIAEQKPRSRGIHLPEQNILPPAATYLSMSASSANVSETAAAASDARNNYPVPHQAT